MAIRKILSCLMLPLCLALATPHLLAAAPKAPAETKPRSGVSLDFKDVELVDLIQTISELTHKNFIYDDTVKGKVTIISPRSMSLAEAYQVFLSVLNIKGFAVVPSGKMNKIVPTREAKENNLPTVLDGAKEASEQYITRLVPLQNIDATTIATTVLTPLLPKTGSVVAFAPTNTLIITDSAGNIERLLTIVKELDISSSLSALEVIPLQNASAEDMVKIATQVLAQTAATPRRSRGVAIPAAGKEVSKIIAYPRTNALVVMADKDDLATIHALVEQLDQKPVQERSNINVYYLENADAETLAKTLNEILTGVKAQARTPRAGQPAATPATAIAEAVTITADKSTNSLVINASPEDLETLKGIVRQLDIKRKQVYVEALIMELSMDATKQLGTSLTGALGTGSEGGVFGVSNQVAPGWGALAPVSGTTVPSLLTQSVQGIMLGGLFNLIDVTAADGSTMKVPALSALIDLSKTDTDLNILSAPRLLTSDNEEAEIIVGSNVPIITSRLTNAVGSSSTVSSGLATSSTVERKDVALTLRFTPQVTEGNLVRLKVYLEITDLANQSVGDVNQVGPTFTKRQLQNMVLAENGKTVVLGGLIGTTSNVTETKVPLLGDLPLLGWLFKRKSTTEKKTNLLVFITPRIIRDASDLSAVTNRSRDAMERFRVEQMGGKAGAKQEASFLREEDGATPSAEATETAPTPEEAQPHE